MANLNLDFKYLKMSVTTIPLRIEKVVLKAVHIELFYSVANLFERREKSEKNT